MQRLFPKRCVSGETSLRINVDSVLHRRSAQHAIFCGEIVSHSLYYDRIAPEREMRSVLLAGTDWYDQTRIITEHGTDLRRIELLDAQRSGIWNSGGKSHRIRG
jgi:hypothetical protein